MKKLTMFIMVLSLLFSLSAGAQKRIGLLGGFNFSDMTSSDNIDFEGKTTFGFGCVIDLKLSEKLNLQIEPMYSKRRVNKPEMENDPAGRVTSTYLEIPVFFKKEFGENVKPYVLLGPTISYFLSGKMEIDALGVTFEGDMKDISRSIDIGAGFGAGISYPAGKFSLFIEGRYIFGLTDFNKGGDIDLEYNVMSQTVNIEDTENKHRGLQIFAGFTLPF